MFIQCPNFRQLSVQRGCSSKGLQCILCCPCYCEGKRLSNFCKHIIFMNMQNAYQYTFYKTEAEHQFCFCCCCTQLLLQWENERKCVFHFAYIVDTLLHSFCNAVEESFHRFHMFVAKEYNLNKKCTKLLYPHERFTPCLCTCAGLFLLFNIQFLLIAKRPSMWQRAEWLPTLFNQVRFLVFWRCIEHVNFALSFVCGASFHLFFFFVFCKGDIAHLERRIFWVPTVFT